MDDQGFDFRQPTEKRAPKPFEPPPWEKEAFDELERRRREKELDEAAEQVAQKARGAEPTIEPPAEPPAERPEASSSTEVSTRDDEAPEKGVDEKQMIEMLAALAAEEPPATGSYANIAVGIGIGSVALGAILIIWGMAALVGAARTGALGWVAGTGLLMFGVFFIGMGVWLAYRALKQRGVL